MLLKKSPLNDGAWAADDLINNFIIGEDAEVTSTLGIVNKMTFTATGSSFWSLRAVAVNTVNYANGSGGNVAASKSAGTNTVNFEDGSVGNVFAATGISRTTAKMYGEGDVLITKGGFTTVTEQGNYNTIIAQGGTATPFSLTASVYGYQPLVVASGQGSADVTMGGENGMFFAVGNVDAYAYVPSNGYGAILVGGAKENNFYSNAWNTTMVGGTGTNWLYGYGGGTTIIGGTGSENHLYASGDGSTIFSRGIDDDIGLAPGSTVLLGKGFAEKIQISPYDAYGNFGGEVSVNGFRVKDGDILDFSGYAWNGALSDDSFYLAPGGKDLAIAFVDYNGNKQLVDVRGVGDDIAAAGGLKAVLGSSILYKDPYGGEPGKGLGVSGTYDSAVVHHAPLAAVFETR